EDTVEIDSSPKARELMDAVRGIRELTASSQGNPGPFDRSDVETTVVDDGLIGPPRALLPKVNPPPRLDGAARSGRPPFQGTVLTPPDASTLKATREQLEGNAETLHAPLGELRSLHPRIGAAEENMPTLQSRGNTGSPRSIQVGGPDPEYPVNG